jgi:bacillolysin
MPRKSVIAGVAVGSVAAVLLGVVISTMTSANAGVQAPAAEVLTDATGRVVSMTPQNPEPSTDGADPAKAARSHLAGVAKVFGVDPSALKLVDVAKLQSGSAVRYQQEINGVPVFGAQIVQNLAQDGSLITALGKTTRRGEGSFPGNAASAKSSANTVAVNKTASNHNLRASEVSVRETTPVWWDQTLGGTPGDAIAKPSYMVHLRGARADQQWSMVVGAERSDVVTSWSETRNAINRDVCDADRKVVSGSAASVRCGTAFKTEFTEKAGAADAGTDVKNVFKFFGQASDFYAKFLNVDLTNLIGADFNDGTGKALRGTVRVCVQGEQCPFPNAFWDGEQMAFGEGVTTLNVTGHELTHGVTQHTSGLRGGLADALNEGLSDVFGKFIGMSANDPNDLGVNRWTIGGGSALGVIRDMQNPNRFQQPDRVNGQFWDTDNPDPHTNNGVVNKTDFLITDGATFNGRTVKGIGANKAIPIWFGVENLLTPRATFQDLGNALNSSCKANATKKVAGITTADCAQVANAVLATQLAQRPK